MPELPEVETTRQGIRPHLEGSKISQVIIRNHSLRWPIDADLASILDGQTIHSIQRRAKYLLLHCDTGVLLIHLGMSGNLRILNTADNDEVGKHAHVDIIVDNGHTLRYTDPRRFGAILWTSEPLSEYKLLKDLGPEPFTDAFNADYLWQQCQTRRCSIKTLVMNGKIVVGAGNIYANEALFLSGIHPSTRANTLTLQQCNQLVRMIKTVLKQAIEAGGTTLKDFRKSDGQPGYFAQQLNVYGREGDDCPKCGSIIQHYKEAQRATFFCSQCQKLTSA
ncbi:MAG: bifunctional DNA-formamidopyrimidine glycosylase/DNA-(apurinic or apyrimidinic site) lyase [Piscirickettsiaceae bacterium]|nr:bifunctional DNA-formamidopyrimidine glycosylase/DNA-(apurinic or apyrimidinic site) lyase [Piscirickettsiaceae bacterium]